MDRSSLFLTIGVAAVLVLLVATSTAEEYFGYREDSDENPDRQNARNRTPIYIPGKCKDNEILYPGDQESDWVCDCRPAYVYNPVHPGCYALYTRGYCDEGEHVEIPTGQLIPKCVKNKCNDNEVYFKDICVTLNKHNEAVCPVIQRIRYVVAVNEATLQLECVARGPIDLSRISKLGQRFGGPGDVYYVTEQGNVLFLAAHKCAPGSAAFSKGACGGSA